MAVVGTAEVVVTAITTGVKKQIKDAFRDARPDIEKEGERYGKAFGNKFRVQLKKDLKAAFTENRDWIKEEGGRQGKLFSAEFVKSLSTELRAKLPGTLDKAFGDAKQHGDEWGKDWSEAANKAVRAAQSLRPEDIVPALPRPAEGGAEPATTDRDIVNIRQRRQRIEEANTRRQRRAARAALAELEALAREQEDRLAEIAQKAADDAVRLEAEKVDRLQAEANRQQAIDNDRLVEHLTQIRQAAQQEEGIAQTIADFSRARHEETQAALDQTLTRLALARRQMEQAQGGAGGTRAALKAVREAEQRYNALRDISDKQALDAERAELETKDREQRLAVAIDAIRDRQLDLQKARDQKKNQAAAKAAIVAAEQARDAAQKEFEVQDRFRQLAADRALADAQETAAALRRLDEARNAPAARLGDTLTIKSQERAHARLKEMAKEVERDREAANARAFADAEELTARLLDLDQRKNDLINARGRQVALAQRTFDAARLQAEQAAITARESALGGARERIRHERIVLDVDRSQLRLDLSREGRGAGSTFRQALISEFANAGRNARDALTSALSVANILGPGIMIAVGAVSSLASSLFALAGAAATAAGSLVVLPALIGALGQAGITAAIAFKGVGQAISAGFQQAGQAAKGGGGGAVINQTRAIADARQALGRVYEDNARRIRDANRRITDAEEGLIKAQNRAKNAQAALTGARERAIESLQQLSFDVEDAALSEERAVLNLQRAGEELAKVQANPASSLEDIQDASLGYREQELAVRRAKDRLQDLEKEQEKSAKAGVEGSKEVVDAQNDIIDANNGVRDAEENLQRAREDLQDAQLQNARALQDAQERLAEAIENQNRGVGAGAGAVDAYQQALAKLSPQAREFVEFIVSLKDDFKALQDAAGVELFPKLTESVRQIVDKVFPSLQGILQSTGGAIGDFALSITDVVTSNGFMARFGQIAEDNIKTIQRFGGIFGSVIDGISGVLVAAGPLVDRFTSFLADKASDFQNFATSGEGIGKMAAFFEHAGDTAAKFGTIIGNVASGLGGLISASDEAGQSILDKLIEVSQRFENFTSSVAGHNELNDFFNAAAENAQEIFGLIFDIVGVFGKLGASPEVKNFATRLRAEWIPVLSDVVNSLTTGGTALADLVVSATRLVRAFTDSTGIQVFLGVLGGIVDAFATLLEMPIIGTILDIAGAFHGAYLAVGLVSIALVGIGSAVATTSGAIAAVGAAIKLMALRSVGQIGLMTTAFQVFKLEAADRNMSGRMATMTAGFKSAGVAARGFGLALKAAFLNPVTGVILAITGAIAIFTRWRDAQREAAEATKAFNETLDQQTGAITESTLTTFLENIPDKVKSNLERAGASFEEFSKAVAGGDEGIDAYNKHLDTLNLGHARQTVLLDQAKQTQADYNEAINTGRVSIAEKNRLDSLATAEALKHAEAIREQKLAQMDLNEELELARDIQEKVNEQYEKAVDAFDATNKVGMNQVRTTIRVEAGYDKLGTSIGEVNDRLAEQNASIRASVDPQKGLTQAQKDQIAANEAQMRSGEEAVRVLDLTNEAGREAATQILDQTEAINEQYKAALLQAGVSGDVTAATAAANVEWEKQKDALKAAAIEAGVTEGAYDTLISKVTTPIEEQQIKFKLIWEEQQLINLMEDIRKTPELHRIEAEVGLIMTDQGDFSAHGYALAVGKALLDEPSLVAVLPITVRDSAIRAAQEEIKKAEVDENGKPYEAGMIPKVNQDKIDEANKILNALGFQEGSPGTNREAVYDTIADETRAGQLRIMLEEIRRPGGKDRTIPFTPDEEGKIAKFEGELAAIEARKRTVTFTIGVTLSEADRKELALTQEFITKTKVLGSGGPRGIEIKAGGGPIVGRGGPTADKVGPFMLSSGEFVLSAKAVRALGGLQATTALHKMLRAGFKIPGMQTGGVVLPTPGGTLVRLGEGGQSERVQPLDHNQLTAGDKAIINELRGLKRLAGFNLNIENIHTPAPERSALDVIRELREQSYKLGQAT